MRIKRASVHERPSADSTFEACSIWIVLQRYMLLKRTLSGVPLRTLCTHYKNKMFKFNLYVNSFTKKNVSGSTLLLNKV